MNARTKLGMSAAVSVVMLGGCAGMGGKNAGLGIPAAAATATPATVTFAQADLNGDARIDRREFSLWLRQSADAQSAQAAAGGTNAQDAFYAGDTDLNGVLTLDEWHAMTQRPGARGGASR